MFMVSINYGTELNRQQRKDVGLWIVREFGMPHGLSKNKAETLASKIRSLLGFDCEIGEHIYANI